MAPLCGEAPERSTTTGESLRHCGGGGNGLWFDQLVVPLVKIDENHVVPNRAAYGLRRPPRLPQTPVGTDVLVLLTDDDHGLSEQGDHQRVTTVWDRRDEIDEVPPGPVGRGHLTPKDPVVRRDGHAPRSAGAVVHEGSLGSAIPECRFDAQRSSGPRGLTIDDDGTRRSRHKRECAQRANHPLHGRSPPHSDHHPSPRD